MVYFCWISRLIIGELVCIHVIKCRSRIICVTCSRASPHLINFTMNPLGHCCQPEVTTEIVMLKAALTAFMPSFENKSRLQYRLSANEHVSTSFIDLVHTTIRLLLQNCLHKSWYCWQVTIDYWEGNKYVTLAQFAL